MQEFDKAFPYLKKEKLPGQLFDAPFEEDEPERILRVISNQVRFGCGYRNVDGNRQYFAWHGYPNRNDDFITTAEITKAEYDSINAEYPYEIVADRETAEVFRRKYVNGRPVLLEGWNKLL